MANDRPQFQTVWLQICADRKAWADTALAWYDRVGSMGRITLLLYAVSEVRGHYYDPSDETCSKPQAYVKHFKAEDKIVLQKDF